MLMASSSSWTLLFQLISPRCANCRSRRWNETHVLYVRYDRLPEGLRDKTTVSCSRLISFQICDSVKESERIKQHVCVFRGRLIVLPYRRFLSSSCARGGSRRIIADRAIYSHLSCECLECWMVLWEKLALLADRTRSYRSCVPLFFTLVRI